MVVGLESKEVATQNLEINVESISEKKIYRHLLILTVIFGFIFRLINVNTRELLGDPPHFAIQAINFLNSGLLVVWDQSGYLWYAFTDIFYDLLGITQFATRFSSLLFSTLSIIAIYFFVLEFSKNKKIALLSSIIYAFAPGIIWQVADEHDISALFFIIMAFYTLIKGLNNKSKPLLLISGMIFGVSAMWKAYVAILLVPYLGMMIYYHTQKKFNIQKNWKTVLVMFLIIGFVVSPTFVYNYSNYKHNGVVDFIFANFLNIKNDKIVSLYGWTSAGEIHNSGGVLASIGKMFIHQVREDGSTRPPIIYYALKSLYSTGHFLVIAGLISLAFIFLRRKERFAKDYFVFFLLYFIIPFLFISYGNYLSKHLVQFTVFAIPLIAYSINELFLFLETKFTWIRSAVSNNLRVYGSYALLLAFVFFFLLSIVTPQYQSFLSPNPAGKFIDYKLENIPLDSLIVYDDRIYNSEAGWLFNDRYYISVSLLNEFMGYSQNSSMKQSVPVYFIECGVDDCGWGTVGSNPQLNSSMEYFFKTLTDQSIPVVFSADIKVNGIKYYNPLISKKIDSPDYLRVYKTTLDVDLNLAKQIKEQYHYFLYPTGYINKKSDLFKNFIYAPNTPFEIIINKFAWFMFYLNIVLSFSVILFLLWESYLYIF